MQRVAASHENVSAANPNMYLSTVEEFRVVSDEVTSIIMPVTVSKLAAAAAAGRLSPPEKNTRDWYLQASQNT
jgi:hypothetical protein